MTPIDRAWCIRIGCFVVLAQFIGYLLAIELRGRCSQDVCALVVMAALSVLDEVRLSVKRRRALSAPRPLGCESSARPFQDR